MRKIDIYVREIHQATGHVCWVYRRSTNWSRTCKEAKANFLAVYPEFAPDAVRCEFAV